MSGLAQPEEVRYFSAIAVALEGGCGSEPNTGTTRKTENIMGGLTLAGQVLSVAHLTGSNTNDRTGLVESYDYHRLRVLVEDEVHDVKLDHQPGGSAPLFDGGVPEKGATVALDVSVSAYKDRTSGRAVIAFRGLRHAAHRPAAVRQAS